MDGDDIMKTKIRILDTAYNSKGKHSQVEIYGITATGEKVVALDNNFYPYMYIAYDDDVYDDLICNPDVLRCSITALEHGQEMKRVIKVTFRFPWMLKDIRNKYKEANKPIECFSGDINFGLKYLFDKNLGDCVEIEGREVITDHYTTTNVIMIDSICNAETFDFPLRILSFDIENFRDGRLMCLCAAIMDEDGNVLSERKLAKGGEAAIIEEFVRYYYQEQPDILTGYFINGYDLPMLGDKCVEFGLFPECKNRLPLSSNKRGILVREKNVHTTGLVVADAHYWARTKIKPKKESLNFVANLLLGEEKDDVDRTDMDGEWARDSQRVIDYCLKDAILAGKVLVKTEALKDGKMFMPVTKLPFSDVMADHQSFRTDSLLVRRADRDGIAVPLNDYSAEKTEKIEGGYVKELPPGIFPMVIGLDFKSMYPSMIINNNLCFTTYDMENGTIISPVGAKFLSTDIRLGIIPQEMKRLGTQRDYYKGLRDDAEKSGDNESYKYYDGLQNATKIMMNSFYGVQTTEWYRFTNKEIGASITGFARANSKHVINELIKEGYNVLYSDTDSIFFAAEKDTIEEAVELGEMISKKYSYGDALLEFEKLMDPLFSIGKKKKYFGKIIWPFKGEITRGFQNRRGDSFDYLSKTLDKLFLIIGDREYIEAAKYARERLREMKKQEVPIVELVTSKSVKDEKEYVNPDSMANVQAARKLRKMGLIVPANTKVDWIVTDATVSPMIVEPYHPSLKNDIVPDWIYYQNRFITTLTDIVEVLGMTELELSKGQKQMSICDY